MKLQLNPWQILRCPCCGAVLHRDGGSFRCMGNGKAHTFDLAKEGYLYLLRSGGNHGDDKAMIRSRHALLESHCYKPLQTALTAAVAETAEKQGNRPLQILDAGCGEGYYTAAVLKAAPQGSAALGIDLSKEGLRLAGKRGRELPLALAAASVYAMPVADDSVDCLLSVFSPFAAEEFRRILKKDGILFSVIPDRLHLFELKSLLYETPYENEVKDTALPGFLFEGATSVSYEMTLSREILQNLFTMTPYAYRTPAEGKKRLSETEQLTLTLAFLIHRYRRM